MLCEYAHAIGNGPGLLEGYEEAFRTYPRLQGEFIWEWNNHGLFKQESDGKAYYAYGGNFGEKLHDGIFAMDGLCNSEHEPTLGLLELKEAYQPVHISMLDENSKSLVIENTYDFNDLSHLRATFKVEEFGER